MEENEKEKGTEIKGSARMADNSGKKIESERVRVVGLPRLKKRKERGG